MSQKSQGEVFFDNNADKGIAFPVERRRFED